MAFDSVTGQQTLSQFLTSWPLEAIDTMTIDQYANLQSHNAYCYWLEYGSRDLGEIGGMPLTKFGLWKYKNRKDFSDTYSSDEQYAWNSKFGANSQQAFRKIKSTIKQIATAAYNEDWELIDSIEFHSVAKWKIAFMYSSGKVLPIYTREGLLSIAYGLGGKFAEDAKIVELQRFIISKRSSQENVIDFARHLWEHYVKGKPFRNYYIIGTKYKNEEGKDTNDIFPDMLATNSVAIGFLYNQDLTHLIGATDDEIDQYIEENTDGEIALDKLQTYFRIFLNLKPGDIIALKSQGSFGNLEIIAYAVVCQRNGKIYEHRLEELGHHVNVEFVEINVRRKTGLNYAGTIHKISPDRQEHLLKIFGPFLQVDNIAVGDEKDDNGNDGLINPTPKSEESYTRGPIAERIVRQLHNIIQNSLYKDLRKKHPNDKIILEYEGRVDIMRESKTERFLYEVKPFENVVYCLRQAIGQLIEYSFRFPIQDKDTRLIIVGPGEVDGEAISFLNHYEEVINYPIEYIQHMAPVRQQSTT
jgi:hypothetical protein